GWFALVSGGITVIIAIPTQEPVAWVVALSLFVAAFMLIVAANVLACLDDIRRSLRDLTRRNHESND
ncbi:MAG: hypothetical protein ACE5E6_12625, partial [Phycisphaerae bacterium]